jgi:hypothetical protein
MGDVMKIATGLLAVVAALGMLQVAHAAVPKISGAYIVSVSNTCQEQIKLTKSGVNVTDVNKTLQGQFEETIAKATFNATAGTFGYVGTRVHGDNMLIFGKGGQAIIEGPDTLPSNTAYSNDTATVTLGGNVFKVIYGAVTAAGVANSFMFQRKDGNCVTKGIAVR